MRAHILRHRLRVAHSTHEQTLVNVFASKCSFLSYIGANVRSGVHRRARAYDMFLPTAPCFERNA
jgi:hypothetical protein